MPFIILLVGIVLVVAGLQGTLPQLGTLLKGEFQGKYNFGTWLFAFFVIGAFGYIPKLKPLSDAFLLLVILVIVLVNDKAAGSGFFANIQKVIANTGSSPNSNTITTNNPFSGSLTSGGIYSSQNQQQSTYTPFTF